MAAMDSDNPKRTRPILILLIWLIFTSVIALVGYPKVKAAFKESGVLSLLSTERSGQASTATTRLVRCAFILPNGKTALYAYQGDRLGGSAYHDTFEALLAGAPREALEEGAISYIDAKTQLRGVTLSNAILFVDFDSPYLASQRRDLADAQVKATARHERYQGCGDPRRRLPYRVRDERRAGTVSPAP
mgnify:CR=1 FL=1